MEEKNFIEILSKIVSNPQLEREWLEMLSQLEYVGCRKIVKSQKFENISLDVLQHIAEEASHAFLLKKVASKLGDGGERHWNKTVFSELGWGYFQSLDFQISEKFSNRAYSMVSWAVERRVMKIYPQYIEMTQDQDVQQALQEIIAQETRHARQFSDFHFETEHKEVALSIEKNLWNELLCDISPFLDS